jgi:hypothetical protein
MRPPTYNDTGTVTATSSDGASTTTLASDSYANHTPGFADSPALTDPTFVPDKGVNFGYTARVPPNSAAQPIPAPEEPLGHSGVEAERAIFG